MFFALEEQLLADLRFVPLSFEVSARSNLKVVVISVVVMAVNVFAGDAVDDALSVVPVVIKAAIIEIGFIRASEVMFPGIAEAIVLVQDKDGVALQVLQFSIVALIELSNVLVEFRNLDLDLAVNVTLNLCNRVIDLRLS